MGITFSFAQLVLDHCYIDNIKKIPSLTKLPESVDDPSFVKELVAAYHSGFQLRKENDFSNHRQKKNVLTAAQAKDFANEIIQTHRVPLLDRPTLNQLRRIIFSAE